MTHSVHAEVAIVGAGISGLVAVLACLSRLYGPAAAKPERFLVGSWVEDPWTRGCYAGYMTPGAWTPFGRWLRMPHGRIHWARSETATRWIGFMDGAVTAGERAARDVSAALMLARGIGGARYAA